MTTVCSDGISMAGDGFVVDRGTIIHTSYPKVVRLKDGRIMGFAGNLDHMPGVLDWLEDDTLPKPRPDADDRSLSVLLLHPDGTMQLAYHQLVFTDILPPAAIGSGMDFALTAMDLGCSPAEAVRAAAARDVNTGGEITVEVRG